MGCADVLLSPPAPSLDPCHENRAHLPEVPQQGRRSHAAYGRSRALHLEGARHAALSLPRLRPSLPGPSVDEAVALASTPDTRAPRWRTASLPSIPRSRASRAPSRRTASRQLSEGGHHLLGEDLEAPHLLGERQQTAGVQLGRDARQAELFLELTQAIDQTWRGTESDLAGEDVLVGEGQQATRLIPTHGNRAGTCAAERLEGQARLALHVVGDRLAGFCTRGLFRRRGVERDAQTRIAVAGMARLAPRLAVDLEAAGQLRDVHAAEAHEDGEAHAPHARERLRRGRRHAEEGVRLAIGERGDGDVLELVELPRVAEGLPLPGGENDFQRLEETGLALSVRHAESAVGARAAAAADAEVEASLAQLIQGGDLAGHAQGVVQGQELDSRAHPEALGAGHGPARDEERGGQHRASRIDHHLSEPHDIEAPGLGGRDELRDLLEGLGRVDAAANLLDEDSEVHLALSRANEWADAIAARRPRQAIRARPDSRRSG